MSEQPVTPSPSMSWLASANLGLVIHNHGDHPDKTIDQPPKFKFTYPTMDVKQERLYSWSLLVRSRCHSSLHFSLDQSTYHVLILRRIARRILRRFEP